MAAGIHKFFCATFLCVLWAMPARIGAAPVLAAGPEIGAVPVAEGLVSPVGVVPSPDGTGRLFVIDQIGVIRILDHGSLSDGPFLDLRERIVKLDPGYDE